MMPQLDFRDPMMMQLPMKEQTPTEQLIMNEKMRVGQSVMQQPMMDPMMIP